MKLGLTRELSKDAGRHGIGSVPLIAFPDGTTLQTCSEAELAEAFTRNAVPPFVPARPAFSFYEETTMPIDPSAVLRVMPQWQGGDNPGYRVGSRIQDALVPEVLGPVATISVPPAEGG